MKKTGIMLCCFLLLVSSCFSEKKDEGGSSGKEAAVEVFFEAPASIPSGLIAYINANQAEFISELERLIANDTDNLLILVDKKNLLPADFVPPALVPLSGKGTSYTISRNDLSLRANVEAALEEMAAAARKEGITLLASSTYRSYQYQVQLYNRYVREMGQEAADRESARPGASQHQLGTVVDFGSITPEFIRTRAGRWLDANAARFGWSLSFPDGYEDVTGYLWECWHYRYIGPEATAFQQKWFNNIQQYMLEFIDAWKSFKKIIPETLIPIYTPISLESEMVK
ncbi:M15 family metallopeptidase [Brucepastera parasyntrophica]|uniref:M15 family metallopeptidase n=1 Tax=Brucepastera parasyntrophica TaxID=2880008 RepID=UPI00210A7B6D|nr:M15 family metallopeptidase [Brucepastera parasyntrophica]ULQ58857.1 M15 family metallopeptidase [Brucepastera parasyntrophica]